MPAMPIGRKEDLHLEFKSRDALKDPGSIAREVVAMLNAGGGDVWIGIGEEQSVATRIEPVDDPGKRRRDLWNQLIDTIEPPPLPGEVTLEEIPLEAGGSLLKAHVEPGKRKPYALVRKGGRHFVLRVGERVRSMTRGEIATAFGRVDGTADDLLSSALEQLKKDRDEELVTSRGGLWIALRPAFPVRLDLSGARERLERMLREPRETDNRDMGWNFTSQYNEIRLSGGVLRSGSEDAYHTTVMQRDGSMVFRAPPERLHWQGPEDQLWPHALMEYPVSFFRLARQVYLEFGGPPPRDARFAAALALFRIHGKSLTPDSGLMMGFNRHRSQKFDTGQDLLVDPVVFEWEDLESRPDACAMRLVLRIYDEFGFAEPDLPPEYDRKRERLILPA